MSNLTSLQESGLRELLTVVYGKAVGSMFQACTPWPLVRGE